MSRTTDNYNMLHSTSRSEAIVIFCATVFILALIFDADNNCVLIIMYCFRKEPYPNKNLK